MGDEEVKELKGDIVEIKEAIKDVSAVVCDMRILLAGNYITKREFEEYKRENRTSRRWWTGFIIAAAGAFAGFVNVFWK